MKNNDAINKEANGAANCRGYSIQTLHQKKAKKAKELAVKCMLVSIHTN